MHRDFPDDSNNMILQNNLQATFDSKLVSNQRY